MVYISDILPEREPVAKLSAPVKPVKLGDGRKKPQQTRARTPRVRTGCKQCKQKHIKCDEGKPSCQRCLIGGRACEGLAYSGVALPPPRCKGNPYEEVAEQLSKDTLWRAVITAVPSAISNNLFRSEKDWDHFQFFILMGSPYEPLPEGCLQLLTPQVAHLVPAVKEVCCAVGAFSRTMHLSGEKRTECLGDATNYYSRAVALLRACTPTKDNLLSVCVASLMFTTYEMLSRNPDEACAHFKYACLIFQQYLAKRCKDERLPMARLRFTELETAMSDALQRLSIYPWSHDLEIERPTMKSHLLGCCRGLPYTSLLNAMPRRFFNIREASKWWDTAQHFVSHHAAQGRVGGAAEQSMWAQCDETLRSWHSRFFPLYQLIRREDRGSNECYADRYLQALMLETLYLRTLASISRNHHDGSNILPATTPLYKEILTVTRQRIPPRSHFGEALALPQEKYLLRPLAYVLHECDDPQIVAEAWDVLHMIEKPGMITRALVGQLAENRDEKPMSSAMLGWTWDFSCAGSSTVATMLEKDIWKSHMGNSEMGGGRVAVTECK